MKIEIYSDIACPWCFIGERRFARALDAYENAEEVEVVFRPYQLDPNAPEIAIPHADYLAQRYGSHAPSMNKPVEQAGEGEGIEFDFQRALAVNTRTAHLLLSLAEREHGAPVQRELAERLFELHFSRGGNVGDPEQLATEAAGVGMDRDEVLSWLLSGEGLRDLESQFAAARSLGIQAVPTFVFEGRWAVQGAASMETFLQAMEEVERATTPPGPGNTLI